LKILFHFHLTILQAYKKTRENYLDSFENEIKKEYSKKLVAFKNEEG
jgi:ABC-type transporter MlaC component